MSSKNRPYLYIWFTFLLFILRVIPLDIVNNVFYDFNLKHFADTAGDPVKVVSIDNESLMQIGSMSWPFFISSTASVDFFSAPVNHKTHRVMIWAALALDIIKNTL